MLKLPQRGLKRQEKRWKCEKTQPPFFASFPGYALTASRASVATLAIFASRGGCKNACWGASPNPALWDKLSQSLLSASPSLIAPVPYFALVRQAEQMIDICLDRHGLPHLLLGRPVLGIEGFFPRCKFAVLFF